jgi:hypothetical protein
MLLDLNNNLERLRMLLDLNNNLERLRMLLDPNNNLERLRMLQAVKRQKMHKDLLLRRQGKL